MSKFRRDVTIEILVGLFIFTVLIALGVFTIVLSRENIFEKSYQYEFVFSHVGGLREGDNVYLRGMNIGRVRQTTLNESRVYVYVTLDVPIELRRGYEIDVVDSSMLGGKYLKVYEGPEGAEPIGDQVTVLGNPPQDIIQELSKAVDGLQGMIDSVSKGQGTLGKLLNNDEMYNNMVVVSEDLKTISSRLVAGEGTVGRLLNDDKMYDDAQATASNLRTISDRLVAGESTLGRLVSEDELYNDTQAMVSNLRTVSDRLAAGEGTLGRLMSGEDKMVGDLEAAMTSVRNIAESIDNGEGTLGLLIQDAKLYEEATLMVEDVRAAVDDLREASPITSFGSVLFGAF